MQLEMTGTVVANDPGAQVYFIERFHDQPAFPFDAGRDEFRAICVPEHELVALVAADRDLEFPLSVTIRDPESYSLSIEPDTDTTPNTTKWP